MESSDKFLRVEGLQIQSSRTTQDRMRLMIPAFRVSGYIATPAAATKPAEKAGAGH
jgi:hypothetical protein